VTFQRKRFRKNGCEIFACTECGLGHVATDAFDPGAYYTDSYFSGGHADGYADYAGSEAVLRREFAATLQYLRRFVPSGQLLEVGCAYGFFLLEAQRFFDVWGIEIAPGAVHSCHERGLTRVQCGRLDARQMSQLPPMNAIALLDVIEHLPDPDEAFRLAALQLAPGGVAMLTTGNWNSMLARITGRAWRLMTPPQHLFFFTVKSFESLAQRHGLRIEAIDSPWKRVPLSLMLHQMKRMLGLRPNATREHGSLGRLGIPVNLFDTIRLVLRKPRVNQQQKGRGFR
jgi:SAM-dependent methyltransferase